MHGVYQEIYVKNNETTRTAVFWFLCVANVYIDPVKKNTNFSNQSGRDADGHSLSLYVDFLVCAIYYVSI